MWIGAIASVIVMETVTSGYGASQVHTNHEMPKDLSDNLRAIHSVFNRNLFRRHYYTRRKAHITIQILAQTAAFDRIG